MNISCHDGISLLNDLLFTGATAIRAILDRIARASTCRAIHLHARMVARVKPSILLATNAAVLLVNIYFSLRVGTFPHISGRKRSITLCASRGIPSLPSSSLLSYFLSSLQAITISLSPTLKHLDDQQRKKNLTGTFSSRIYWNQLPREYQRLPGTFMSKWSYLC